VFGLGEIREREVGEREFEEKVLISLVWFKERCEREILKPWDPHAFYFSAKERRKRRESDHFNDITILPISSSLISHLKIAVKLKMRTPKVVEEDLEVPLEVCRHSSQSFSLHSLKLHILFIATKIC
jgi:hypothetical protein